MSVVHDYDDLGRRVSSTATDGTDTVSKSFDYDLAGRLTSAASGSVTLTMTYDDRGLPLTASGANSTATWSYDDDGRMVTKVDAAGTTAYTWNAQSRLESVTAPGATGPAVFGYNTAGQYHTLTLPGTGERTFGYDAFGRLESDELSDGTTVTSLTEYDRDEDGNIVGEHITGSGRAGVGDQTYDARNRLVATSDGWTYDYSARGDVVSRTDGTTTVSTGFDPFGRLVDTGTSTVTYDALDRPLSIDTDGIAYAGTANEPSEVGGETMVRDPKNRLVGTDAGSGIAWWLADVHGDATVATDDDGALAGSVEFDPFGVRTTSTGATSTVGFQSDLTDVGSGAVWMGARWFDPARAGFVSRDSFSGRPSEPNSLNRYAYAEGNPLTRWDPTGFETKKREIDRSHPTLTPGNVPTTSYQPVGPPPDETGWVGRIVKVAAGPVVGFIVTTFCMGGALALAPETGGASLALGVGGGCSVLGGAAARGTSVLANGGSVGEALDAATNLKAMVTDYAVGSALTGFSVYRASKVAAPNLESGANGANVARGGVNNTPANLTDDLASTAGTVERTEASQVTRLGSDATNTGGRGLFDVRSSNAVHPPSASATEAMGRSYHPNCDCSEIAQDIMSANGGTGRIARYEPTKGSTLKTPEAGGARVEDYVYHEVYTDGRYAYDPNFSPTPVPMGDYNRMMRGLNPGVRGG